MSSAASVTTDESKSVLPAPVPFNTDDILAKLAKVVKPFLAKTNKENDGGAHNKDATSRRSVPFHPQPRARSAERAGFEEQKTNTASQQAAPPALPSSRSPLRAASTGRVGRQPPTPTRRAGAAPGNNTFVRSSTNSNSSGSGARFSRDGSFAVAELTVALHNATDEAAGLREHVASLEKQLAFAKVPRTPSRAPI